MPITKYENMVLENKLLVLEESWLIGCLLRGCTIFYSGGACHVEGARFENCTWKFSGPAAATLHVLQMAGLLTVASSQIAALSPGEISN